MKTVKCWTEENMTRLDCTDWRVYLYNSSDKLGYLFDVVFSYITFCIDSHTLQGKCYLF